MIKFSIITCTYNAESVLQRTLDSVMKQTCCNVEHLIIDGKSKDKTLAMVKAYKHKNDVGESAHEIRVFSEPDKGLYDAMNKGIRFATGDYVIFLNAGDVFPNAETLETVVASIGDGEQLPGVLYGDTDIVATDGHFLRHRRLSPPKRLTWRSFQWGMLVCHQAFYARTDLAKETPYNNVEYRFSADVDWCIRIMKLCAKRRLALRNVSEVIVNYLDGGMTNKNHKASLKERFRVMAKHYGFVHTALLHLYFVIRSFVKK